MPNDPPLSAETRRRLTEELRAAVGRDAAVAPTAVLKRPAPHNGPLLLLGVLVLLVLGAVASATSDHWIFVVLAFLLGLLALAAMTAATLRRAGEVEHPSPDLAAELQDEGIADPDQLLTDLVERYADGKDE